MDETNICQKCGESFTLRPDCDSTGFCDLCAQDIVAEMQERPKIVCICGSTRFVDVMAVEAWKLEKQGIMALSPHLLPQWYEGVKEHHQAEAEGVAHVLDELHLRKIDLSDEVLVVNVNGYIGDRTRAEIAYANNRGKPVGYLEPIPSNATPTT